MTNRMFFRTLFGAFLIIIGGISVVMTFVCLGRGNWIGGFFAFPILTYLSLDKFFTTMKGAK